MEDQDDLALGGLDVADHRVAEVALSAGLLDVDAPALFRGGEVADAVGALRVCVEPVFLLGSSQSESPGGGGDVILKPG